MLKEKYIHHPKLEAQFSCVSITKHTVSSNQVIYQSVQIQIIRLKQGRINHSNSWITFQGHKAHQRHEEVGLRCKNWFPSGYGHIAPKTILGRAACIVYALIGIPLNGILLKSISDLLSNKVKLITTLKNAAIQPLSKWNECLISVKWVPLWAAYISWFNRCTLSNTVLCQLSLTLVRELLNHCWFYPMMRTKLTLHGFDADHFRLQYIADDFSQYSRFCTRTLLDLHVLAFNCLH